MIIREFEKKFPAFWQAWATVHEEANKVGKGQRGHGPDHDLVVLGYCLLLAGEDQRLAEMSGCAALLHSFDRLGAEDKIASTVEQLGDYFSGEELVEILLGVDQHNKPNSPDDLPTQINLQDSDRLTNIGPTLIARSGQFLPTIPVIELEYQGFEKNPMSTYRQPMSVHDDVKSSLEWETDPLFCLRSLKAREMAEKYFNFLRQYILLSKIQLEEVGL